MRKVDHDHRRIEVAEAAAKLISREGMEGLTTRALAKELGCSIGVLSHYFHNKEEIVIAAFRWADQRIDARMQAALAEDFTLDTFLPVIRAGLPLDAESDLEWRVRTNLHTFAMTHKASLKAERDKFVDFRTIIGDMIERLQREGHIRNDISAADLTLVMFDLVVGLARNLLMLPLTEREDHASYLFRLIEQLRPI
ncbi:TetR/AcrR family transcriptional regulator [Spongiibacter sp. KMU-158]|uniref:TetR/AcrR family transcriptional regulator n=1 Tax=Spongiibacter pelagi TaxID=2760804 RepID=A0A927GVE3_9GAMM|nr:TetR/AcrR family transcriptional regulator [Spongiibacter pelagi]MBD2857792.1 TetR/AcrR family transcriptional regulator [Spongiibacter pelagi]